MKRTIILIAVFLCVVFGLIAWDGSVEKEKKEQWGLTEEEKELHKKMEDGISTEEAQEMLRESRECLEETGAIGDYLAANYNYEKYTSDISEDELEGTKIYIEGTVVMQILSDEGAAVVLDVEIENGNYWRVVFGVENGFNIMEGRYIRAFGEYFGLTKEGEPMLLVLDTNGEQRACIQEKDDEIGFKTIYNAQEYWAEKHKTEEDSVENAEEQSAYVPTLGESNAFKSARSYLEHIPFSYTGLIEQLEFEKYSHEEAVYAVDNCGADWNEQAAKKAKSYLDMMSFSRDGLIEQLEFEGFTHEQAVYGVTQNGY